MVIGQSAPAAPEPCLTKFTDIGGHCKPSLYRFPDLQERVAALGIEETLKIINFELKNLSLLSSYVEENSIDCDFHLMPSCDAYFDQASFDLAVSSVDLLKTFAPELAAR